MSNGESQFLDAKGSFSHERAEIEIKKRGIDRYPQIGKARIM